MPSNVAWGIELGSAAIKGVKLLRDGDEVVVQDFSVVQHPKVLSTPELDTDEAMRTALAAFAAQNDLSKATIGVTIAGHQSFSRFAKLPPVEPKKVPDIVKFEAMQQIPFPLEDVEWDYQTFVSPDSPDIEVGIFAVTRQRVMERINQLADVGITPDLVNLAPVAGYNALAYDLDFTEETPGTIILDIGTTATDMVIAEAGRVWTATFPIGGHQFTDALVAAFKLSYSKAERLKREAEQTKHARHAFQAMRPVFTDLVQELQRRIGYYQSLHTGADLKRLIGLGQTFQLPGLRKYLKQQLDMDVYRIEEFKKLRPEGPRGPEFRKIAATLTPAYGLALQGVGLGTLEANLVPTPIVRDAMWRRKRVWFGAAAGVAAAATAALFIRPMLDELAYSSADRSDATLNRAVSQAGVLRDRAETLGLFGNREGDLTAATMVSLLEGRDLMGWMFADTGMLVQDVRRRLDREGLPSVVEVVALDTQFVRPEAASGRGGNQGFGNQGFGNQGFGNQGFGNGGLGGGNFGRGGFQGGGMPGRGGPQGTLGGGPGAGVGPGGAQTDGDGAGAGVGDDAEAMVDLSSEPHVLVRAVIEVPVERAEDADLSQAALRAGVEAWLEGVRDREAAPYRVALPEPWAAVVDEPAGDGREAGGRGGRGRETGGRGGPPDFGRDEGGRDGGRGPGRDGGGRLSSGEAISLANELAPLRPEERAEAGRGGPPEGRGGRGFDRGARGGAGDRFGDDADPIFVEVRFGLVPREAAERFVIEDPADGGEDAAAGDDGADSVEGGAA